MSVNSPIMVTQLYSRTRSKSMDDELAYMQIHSTQTHKTPKLPSIHDIRGGGLSGHATLPAKTDRTSTIRQSSLAISRRGHPRVAAGYPSLQKFHNKPLVSTNKDGSMSPTSAIARYKRVMSEYELQEIHNFPKVWFVGPTAQKLRCSMQENSSKINFGFDNDKGRYQVVRNDHIAYRYEVLKCLGKGSFGDVMKVYDHQKKEYVALKIIRNEPRFHQQALLEIKLLDQLAKKDIKNRFNVIHMKDTFKFREHTCITFELLKCDLYSELKRTGFKGFKVDRIRTITKDLVNALRNLRRLKIIHCDLKPENILLTNDGRGVKIIDFGSSCHVKDQVHTYIQSRFYRAPEIILGTFPYGCPIDMWSLGCILVELFTGRPIFPGHSEAEQLMYQVEFLGMPPPLMLAHSKRTDKFFDDSNEKLKPVLDRRNHIKVFKNRSIDVLLRHVPEEDSDFIDFIKQTFHWDPLKRMTPRESSRHPFVAGPKSNAQELPDQTSDKTIRRLSEPPMQLRSGIASLDSSSVSSTCKPTTSNDATTETIPTNSTIASQSTSIAAVSKLNRSNSHGAILDGSHSRHVLDVRDTTGCNVLSEAQSNNHATHLCDGGSYPHTDPSKLSMTVSNSNNSRPMDFHSRTIPGTSSFNGGSRAVCGSANYQTTCIKSPASLLAMSDSPRPTELEVIPECACINSSTQV